MKGDGVSVSKMAMLTGLLISVILPSCDGQALPPLPQLPSASPPESPSALPSVLADIIDENQVTSSPTAVDPNDSQNPSQTSNSPSVSGSPSAASPEGQPQPSTIPSEILPIPSTTPAVDSEFVNDDGECIRDVKKPRPKLGKSQLRYAIAVLLSAAAVAFASVFYGIAYEWEPDEDHTALRIIWIVLARLLTVTAIKISAALVASITKASPEDGALDASGAFLTWGTAIFTRLYYEGFKMTMAVLEFSQNDTVWDDKLKHFLSARYVMRKLKDEETNLYVGGGKNVREYIRGRIPILQRLKGGNLERKLLIVTTILYFASEVSVLIANVLVLVGAFIESPDHTNFFSSDDSGGQCGILRGDIPVVGGLVAIQSIYALTQQPSLVPLLTISAFCPKCEGLPALNALIQKLRWIASVVLLMWVVSVLTLPLFEGVLLPLFTAGDLTLFWFVILAPPSYHSASYKITATFTCFAAIVGTYIIFGISRREGVESETLSESF